MIEALLGSLGSALFHKVLDNSYDDDTSKMRRAVSAQLEPYKQNIKENQEYNMDLMNKLSHENVQGTINDWVKGYKQSDYNNYLTQQAVNATGNQAKDAGMFNSNMGKQDIANMGAIAGSSGLKDYIGQLEAHRANNMHQINALSGVNAGVNMEGMVAYNPTNVIAQEGQSKGAIYQNKMTKDNLGDYTASKMLKRHLDERMG